LHKLNAADPLRRNIEEIKKASNRASSLTRQLLAFSRRQVLQPQVLNINSIILDMAQMLPRLIGENIELDTLLDPNLGSVKADPGQIEQVILNLAVNARDAMPDGGRLTIETRNVNVGEQTDHHVELEQGPYVRISVSDNGLGMAPETQEHIFEPFFTTKEAGKGTGLGLSTVYGIIRQSGGSIWVYSELGQGTTLKIYLPRVDEQATRYNRPTVTNEIPKGTETILLVEDEEIVRGLAREVLEMNGYKVLESGDPQDAISLCQRHKGPIHLLLTDVVMPGMSGRTLADRVSKIRPGLRIAYMSGYTSDAIVHHGVLDADVRFIQKPFTPDSLARTLRAVLDEP
jgi:two-component system cell cycle sensor histidine kinase/response regulator CckA